MIIKYNNFVVWQQNLHFVENTVFRGRIIGSFGILTYSWDCLILFVCHVIWHFSSAAYLILSRSSSVSSVGINFYLNLICSVLNFGHIRFGDFLGPLWSPKMLKITIFVFCHIVKFLCLPGSVSLLTGFHHYVKFWTFRPNFGPSLDTDNVEKWPLLDFSDSLSSFHVWQSMKFSTAA